MAFDKKKYQMSYDSITYFLILERDFAQSAQRTNEKRTKSPVIR